MPTRPRIAIVGAGNLAQALAPALRRAGYQIEEIITRPAADSQRRASRLAGEVGAPATTIGDAALRAQIVWVCVSDDQISATARRLALRPGWRGKVALHSSGALSSDELRALRRRGASVGSLHPMMTFVAGVQPELQGVPFAVEGDPGAVRLARRVARDLGGDVFTIGKEAKPLYHAVGSFSSPMIVATLVTAERVARAARIPPDKIASIMQPILRRTIDNYLAQGAAAAFSGPIQRADVETIRKHLRALKQVPGAREVYAALAHSALRSLPVRDRRAVAAVLNEDSRGRKSK